ncbi:hypothetical protein [Streptomyces albipurpureus]|uniref:Uncharacterized protein n=1 Tax=Streptomyces albipurpureus TaxID=2897419 RepID=A0ABT0UL09_9ACTN|nr:hypothetical protein [Streptomyces sp. CWNU-1]MCM2388967.1 hypothetical protein [Streptomyces sp. CWNU-1]
MDTEMSTEMGNGPSTDTDAEPQTSPGTETYDDTSMGNAVRNAPAARDGANTGRGTELAGFCRCFRAAAAVGAGVCSTGTVTGTGTSAEAVVSRRPAAPVAVGAGSSARGVCA